MERPCGPWNSDIADAGSCAPSVLAVPGKSDMSQLVFDSANLPESEVLLRGVMADGTDGNGSGDGDEDYDAMYVKPMKSPKGDDAEELYSKPVSVAGKPTKGVTSVTPQEGSADSVYNEEAEDMKVIDDLKATPNGNPFLIGMDNDDDGFEDFNEENPFIGHEEQQTQF